MEETESGKAWEYEVCKLVEASILLCYILGCTSDHCPHFVVAMYKVWELVKQRRKWEDRVWSRVWELAGGV